MNDKQVLDILNRLCERVSLLEHCSDVAEMERSAMKMASKTNPAFEAEYERAVRHFSERAPRTESLELQEIRLRIAGSL